MNRVKWTSFKSLFQDLTTVKESWDTNRIFSIEVFNRKVEKNTIVRNEEFVAKVLAESYPRLHKLFVEEDRVSLDFDSAPEKYLSEEDLELFKILGR